MSSHYIESCKESILPLSVSDSLKGAFEEWFFTGDVRDRKMQGECHLCGHNPLRWHFLVKSEETDATLWVGSECIKQFHEQRAEQRGEDPEKARDRARNRLREARQKLEKDTVLQSLRRLWKSESSDFQDAIESIGQTIKEHDKVTPKQAKLLVWRAGENDVDLPVEFLDVTLSKNKFKRQMEKMPDWQIEQFWDALGTLQQQRAEERGWIDK